MTIAPITINDIEMLRALQPADWPDIIPHMQTYAQSPFCFPLKLTEGTGIVGTGTLILHEQTAWLAHIIVHPDHRNKGIGSSIVRTLLQHREAMKKKTKLLIATALGEPVYKKAGFRQVSVYKVFKKEKIVDDNKVVPEIVDLTELYIPQLLKLDAAISGEKRERLLLNYIETAKIYLKNGLVRGFYLPSLGEGLILADNDEAGKELLKLKCTLSDMTVLPEENETAVQLLPTLGFKEMRQVKRMILGDDIAWQPQYFYSRIGGNLG
jgi:hypothetical protein